MTTELDRLKRDLERKSNEISALKDYLDAIRVTLRAGDDDGVFCPMLASFQERFVSSRPWHLLMAEEIDDLLDPDLKYGPFEPEDVEP